MDPLSITVSVISLASTLKDILKLASDIYDSFEKVSANMQNARSLASDVVLRIHQLKEFYEDHSNILQSSDAMNTALCHLKNELRLAHRQCLALIPPASNSKMEKAKTALKSWMKRDKLEAYIKELKNHVDTCYIQFTAFTAARLEISTRHIQDVTARIETTTTRIEHHLAVFDHSQTTALQSLKGQIINVSGILPDHLLGDKNHTAIAYLRIEVGAIVQSLTDLARSQIGFLERPLGSYLHRFKPFVYVKPLSISQPTHHRRVVGETLDILRVLQGGISRSSFQEGAWRLVNLSIGLYQVEMYAEATTIGLWAVNLFRILVTRNAEVYQPYLALSLHNLARYYLSQDRLDEAVLFITESLSFSRLLTAKPSTPEIMGQLARSLTTSAIISVANGNHMRALEDSEEAVKIYHNIISRVQDIGVEIPISNEMITSGWVLENVDHPIFQQDIRKPLHDKLLNGGWDDVTYYGQALHQYSYNLHRDGRFAEAITADKQALQIFYSLSSVHPSGIFSSDLGQVLYHLTHHDFRFAIENTEMLSYIQECIAIYRRLSAAGSAVYRKLLYHALWSQGTILRGMGNYAAELETWIEAVNLAKLIQSDQLFLANALYQSCWTLRRLDRLSEAVVFRKESIKVYRSVLKAVSTFEANAYYDLATDFLLTDQHKEAGISAKEAVTQYRILSLANPNQFTRELADSLTLLTSIFLILGNYDEALQDGREALPLYKSLITTHTDPEIISAFLCSLEVNITAVGKSENEEEAIEWGRELVTLSGELAIRYPQEVGWGFPDCLESHAVLLNQRNQLPAARSFIEEAINWHKAHPMDSPEAVERFAICLINHALIVDSQGFKDEALKSLMHAANMTTESAHINSSLASAYVGSRFRQVYLLCELARFQEALEISEIIMSFFRQNASMLDSDISVSCLLAHAIALNHNGQSELAAGIAEEALQVCRSDVFMDLAHKDKLTFFLLPWTLHALSEILSSASRHVESSLYAQEALREALALKPDDISPPRWSAINDNCMSLFSYLSIHPANIHRGIELLLEAKTFYEKWAPIRNSGYIVLARVLRAIGIFYCSCGQHEQGIATASELSSLRKNLAVTLPTLSLYMEIQLEVERQQASWISILAKLNTGCDHQH